VCEFTILHMIVRGILSTAAVTTALVFVAFAPQAQASPASQDNAVRTAQDYLEMQGFSRSGLVKQLGFEGQGDSVAAVDSITVDWNAQAVKSAKDYLDREGFTHSGLVTQLEFEGFTPSQAEYGVEGAGL
jgi:Host cell surface-exposed lipoprotein